MGREIRAAVKVGVERTELRTFERPAIGPACGLLRMEMCGVGGSDPELYRWPEHAPVIMGHECVGTIEEIGSDAARRWNVGPGDRVALHEYLPCWECRWCRQGDFRLCEQADFFLVRDRLHTLRYGMCDCGIEPHLWGGFAEYLYLPRNAVLHRVPAGLRADLATTAIPLGNGFQWSVLDGGAGPGKSVLVFGPGQQGLGCVYAARVAGASQVILVGLTRDAARLDLALHLGADHVIDAQKEDVRDCVRFHTAGRGVDVIVDTTGDPQGQVAADAVALAAKGAQLNLNGLTQSIPLGQVKRLYLTLRAPRGHSYQAVALALRHLQFQQDRLAALCSHTFGLESVDTAIHATAGRVIEGAIHVTVNPHA
ncbi:MAG TPA: alcohol dehydrogenase catalytic domain-containing protein [Steroidobacteraceae bacterium]|nr:alcohol dehydrogenase catalytic domain-containing protein [Steroidobacteraceae bacterium]